MITSAKDALQVMDFEEAARRALPPAHWGYMASGVDDDATTKANREGFAHFRLRPRRLVDVTTVCEAVARALDVPAHSVLSASTGDPP